MKALAAALGMSPLELLKKPTRRERLTRELRQLEKRYLDRIARGRTRGAGAGGFCRDLENIRHLIELKRQEIARVK